MRCLEKTKQNKENISKQACNAPLGFSEIPGAAKRGLLTVKVCQLPQLRQLVVCSILAHLKVIRLRG